MGGVVLEDEVVIAAVKGVHIPGFARPLPNVPEGHLPDAPHFLKQARRLFPMQEIEAVGLLAHQQGRGGQIGNGVFEKGRRQR